MGLLAHSPARLTGCRRSRGGSGSATETRRSPSRPTSRSQSGAARTNANAWRRAPLDRYWTGPSEDPAPLVSGLSEPRVEVRGEWPATRVEVSFRHPHFTNGRMRRVVRVFDAAGRFTPPLYASVHLMEDLATGRLPSTGRGRRRAGHLTRCTSQAPRTEAGTSNPRAERRRLDPFPRGSGCSRRQKGGLRSAWRREHLDVRACPPNGGHEIRHLAQALR